MHILESDRRMALAVRALQSGVPVETAKSMANDAMAGAAKTLIDTVMAMYDQLASRTVQLAREISRRKQAEHELQLANEALREARAAVAATARTTPG
jgi:hypothetical protein